MEIRYLHLTGKETEALRGHVGDLLHVNTPVLYGQTRLSGGPDTERRRAGPEQAQPHLHVSQLTAVPACDGPLPHLVYPQQGHTSKRAVGRGGPGEKAADSPIVTETIVTLALMLLPGAWKKEQAERAHELPPAAGVCPSLAA